MNLRHLKRTLLFFLCMLATGACIDRLDVGVALPTSFPIVVDGTISDQPGPYVVRLSRAFDINSRENPKISVTNASIRLSDQLGNSEILTEVSEGRYETSVGGLQGIVGRVYQLRVELPTGEIFESIPDTLMASGPVDRLYTEYESYAKPSGEPSDRYRVYLSSTLEKADIRVRWGMQATYSTTTFPERDDKGCYWTGSKCNFKPPCTGLLNVASPGAPPEYERVFPCECCTCWYKIATDYPVLSSDFYTVGGRYERVAIGEIPVNPWIFMEKVKIVGRQQRLSKQSYRFFKAIQDQKEGTQSLFQPVSGKIPSNFVQLAGKPGVIMGIFYAGGVSYQKLTIYKEDVPRWDIVIDKARQQLADAGVGAKSCLLAFPNSTNKKPVDWDE